MLTPTSAMLADYTRDGFVVIPQVFPAAVVTPLLEAIGHDALAVLDANGNAQSGYPVEGL